MATSSTHAAQWTYLLPIRSNDGPDVELTHYLSEVAGIGPVLIVDGSDAPVFAAAHDAWSSFATHVPPDANLTCANGKARGVISGMALVSTPYVLIADDDVRYSAATLEACVAQLSDADLVRPQNYFDPLPWHARWDTARTLLNRALGSDFPGTFAMRTEAWNRAGGYDGDVLFENLELIRTVAAAGGRCVSRPDLYVRRLPPSPSHFFGQRVRQAYDELARPWRFALSLGMGPAAAMLVHRRRFRTLLSAAAMSVALAEVGRRKAGGRKYFPASTALFAPLWLGERAVCVWPALFRRLTGGITYANRRVRVAATTERTLRRRLAQRAVHR